MVASLGFSPSKSGSLSEFVARRTFAVLHPFKGMLEDAGPLAIVLVILTWALLMSVGFALIYWAFASGNFYLQTPANGESFTSMLYFSFEVLTTLGLGDFAPRPTYLRLVATTEALMGFQTLTCKFIPGDPRDYKAVFTAFERQHTPSGNVFVRRDGSGERHD